MKPCRALLFVLLTCVGASSVSAQTWTWRALNVGAGGWLTGLDIASDGVKVVRADTYGAYVWNTGTSQWDHLVTATSMGEAAYSYRDTVGMGVFEIGIAASDTDRIYMVWDGYVYRSDDSGASFTKTSFTRDTELDANLISRTAGQKMAVDPNDSDTAYLGTLTDGVYYTHDAGSNWTQILNGTLPFGQGGGGSEDPGHSGIVFDPDSGTDGSGYTNEIIVPSFGNGVWRTVNAGSSWTDITGSGPTDVIAGQMGPDGVYWAADDAAAWKWDGSWTNVRADTYEAVAVDPADGDRIVVSEGGGFTINSSLNAGSTFLGSWTLSNPAPGNPRVATDIPWLAWTDADYMSNGDMRFDPNDGDLYFAMGIGVFKTTFPSTYVAFDWTSQSKGIEQLVARQIWSVPGGDIFVTTSDRGVFRMQDPETFPSQHGIDLNFQHTTSVEHAVNDPSFLAVSSARPSVAERSGYSDDGGATWNAFASYPSNYRFGHIAVSTDQNMVWTAASSGTSYYSKNGGTSWSAVPSPADGVTQTGNYNTNRHIVCADRVTLNKFYLYVSGDPALYVSTNSGDSWSAAYSSKIVNSNDGFLAKLKSVPGEAGDLFYTNGPYGGGDHAGPQAGELFKRSTDGGETWDTVTDVLEVYDFGFGKKAPAGSYPAVFIAGYVSNVFGVWMSDDNCSTWTRVGATLWPNDSLDNIKAVSGDMDSYGTVYVGFAGSGFAYATLDGGTDYGDPGVKRRGHMGSIIIP